MQHSTVAALQSAWAVFCLLLGIVLGWMLCWFGPLDDARTILARPEVQAAIIGTEISPPATMKRNNDYTIDDLRRYGSSESVK